MMDAIADRIATASAHRDVQDGTTLPTRLPVGGSKAQWSVPMSNVIPMSMAS